MTPYKPKPGEDPEYDFKYVMDVFNDPRRPPEEFQEALNRLGETINWVREEAEKNGINFDTVKAEAEELRKKHGGDIFPSLNYLGQFTPVYHNTVRDYLKGVVWWALTAEEYCKRNMEVSKILRENKIIIK